MLAQTIRKVSKVHPSILKTNRFFIFLRLEKSTATESCNHARVTTAEVENLQETVRLCPGFLSFNGDPIRRSVVWS